MSSIASSLETAAKESFLAPFAGVLRIECTDDGSSLWIDGREDAVAISEAAPPEVMSRFCLWRGDGQVLRTVLSGQRRLETAMTAGQLKISGDMAVMARLKIRDFE
ncbi:hypothetical protein HK107_04055 [Parvularcula sp. ZS-1/3]|uniref:SCP2 domain-containing protein n=1 Tax=Parvularcula mediterranea TaxID=2732508 RepID=A0A7Y3RK13_9PROT|nr:SCP2 sterol-binding domain-containing protein [Parvularcula mediterranea]NNU15493.1 hypothetical protein [Parvularcula mediterranea]